MPRKPANGFSSPIFVRFRLSSRRPAFREKVPGGSDCNGSLAPNNKDVGMMNTLFLGLAVALLWGSADTLATYATKRIGTATTTFVAQIAGFLLVAAFGLTVAGRLGLLSFSAHVLDENVLWGVVLGGISAGAYITLYEALSAGPLAVASPVVSAQGGVTLLLSVVLLHERLQ